MPQPETLNELLTTIRKSGLISDDRLDTLVSSGTLPGHVEGALETLVREGALTSFHARHLKEGKSKGFILGPYRVLRPLGKGGMGLVYLAEHTTLNRRVALKILRTAMVDEKGVRERFNREARATASLDHPNIVRLYEFGQDGETNFMVMEYVEGKSLDLILKQEGRLAIPQAVDYAIQTAMGLQHAHERGIVHRDIKPGNLLLDSRGTVRILDMGLARFYDDRNDNLTERVGGGILGSPDFIAPEQARHQLDTRSDIYSLGATLYALLSGQPPFPAASIAQKIIAHQLNPVVPLHHRDPAIPYDLSVIVLRMLAKDPAQRPQTPAEVAEALAPFVARVPEPNNQPVRNRTPAKRSATAPSRWVVLLGVLVLLGATLGGALALGLSRLIVR